MENRKVHAGYCEACGGLLEDDADEHWCPFLDDASDEPEEIDFDDGNDDDDKRD